MACQTKIRSTVVLTDPHLAIAFAAMAISHYIEIQIGRSIKKFVRTARSYRTEIKTGRQTFTAADPLPDDLGDAIEAISTGRAHTKLS